MNELTCIVCPMGCQITVEKDEGDYKVKGNSCKRGIKYAIDEVTNPRRTITTTVKLSNSYLKLLPVKSEGSVSKLLIFEIMQELDDITVKAPVSVGEIIVENILSTGINIISTKSI